MEEIETLQSFLKDKFKDLIIITANDRLGFRFNSRWFAVIYKNKQLILKAERRVGTLTRKGKLAVTKEFNLDDMNDEVVNFNTKFIDSYTEKEKEFYNTLEDHLKEYCLPNSLHFLLDL